jgi:hypothetical protein
MLDKYVLDENGEPVAETDLLAWGRWMESGNRRLAFTKTERSEVSTVFLGIDHGHGGIAPVLWETMVFGGPLDQEQARYASKTAALAGHVATVDRVRALEAAD